MSIITTEYIHHLIITTNDAGETTTAHTYHASTHTAYLFSELDEAAQARAIADAIKEEEDTYYSAYYLESYAGRDIDEMWSAYNELAKHQPIKCHDHYNSFYLTVDDAEKVTEEQDTGICWSMDICDAWNKYAATVELLIEEAEEHEGVSSEINAPYYWPYCVADEEPDSVKIFCSYHDDHADRCREKADELAEKAAKAVESTIQSTIQSLEDYYSSAEFWREELEEAEARFTRSGERI